MQVALCIPSRPKSVNARPSPKYAAAISDQARSKHVGDPFHGPLYSRIIWFHKNPSAQGDIDNVAKKIHDALKGVLFVDDRVITHTLAIRVDASQAVQIVGDPSNPGAELELADYLADPANVDVLYIEIGEQFSKQARLGPIL